MAGSERDPSAVEHHLEVSRTARYWTLGAAGGARAEVWFALHGYGQLARRFLRRFRGLAEPSRLIVAPEGLSRFYVGSELGRHGPDSVVGATWMTREDREMEIRDYVAYLDRLAATLLRGEPRVTVLGFSQGVATAWRWVTYGTVPGLARLVLWAGAVPPDLDLARAARTIADVEVVLVRGGADRTARVEQAAEEEALLSRAGIGFRVVRHAGGHDIDEATLLSIAG